MNVLNQLPPRVSTDITDKETLNQNFVQFNFLLALELLKHACMQQTSYNSHLIYFSNLSHRTLKHKACGLDLNTPHMK